MAKTIRIVDGSFQFTPQRLRTPLKFGGGIVSEITSATATITVTAPDGQTAAGRGNILLSDLWAFPTPRIPHETKDLAMRAVSERFLRKAIGTAGHPIEIYFALEDELRGLCAEITHELGLAEPFPLLAALVCASPVDAAVHDAFGRLNRVSSYRACSAEFMEFDLSKYLGADFEGTYPSDFLRTSLAARLPIFHLVGGVDKLSKAEVAESDPKDGLPVSLEEWIERDGVYCLKVKLRGNDLAWDVERTLAVYRVARATLSSKPIHLTADSNEMCESPEYVIEYFRKLRERDAGCFDALLYYEQPTERDLAARRFDMRRVAQIKPVLADEGVTDLESLELARSLGWSGIALKTCKGHSSALLYLAKCARYGMPYSIQDLTNIGLGLIHSAGLAASSAPIMGFEYNARQYLPFAEPSIQRKHASLFTVAAGTVSTETLAPLGLGY